MRSTRLLSPAAVLKNAPSVGSSNSSRILAVSCDRGFHVPRIEVGFIKIQQRANEERVVVQETGDRRVAIAIPPLQHARRSRRTCASE